MPSVVQRVFEKVQESLDAAMGPPVYVTDIPYEKGQPIPTLIQVNAHKYELHHCDAFNRIAMYSLCDPDTADFPVAK